MIIAQLEALAQLNLRRNMWNVFANPEKSKAVLLADGTDMGTFVSFLETSVVNEETREKYRNPPAHTRYLPYKTACECRDFFHTLMLQLTAALKGKEQ